MPSAAAAIWTDISGSPRPSTIYTARQPEGSWEKHNMEGFYHDCSLLFDDDGKKYIVYGNREVRLTQLKEDLSGPLEGGLHRILVNDRDNPNLGYEGSHIYKISGKYYLFLIHSRPDRWMRTEACFAADSLEGEFLGGDVLEDDAGLPGCGVAQGPVVDTPEGKWYALQFQDMGAAGRIPYLIPVTWKDDYPVFGENGKIPKEVPVESTRPGYGYAPLVGSDDFRGELKYYWEFNHEPDRALIHHDRENGIWQVRTDKVSGCLLQARNTLTQRMLWPGCAAEVTVDGSGLKEGDFAGLCALQACFGFLGLTRRNGRLYLVVRTVEPGDAGTMPPQKEEEREWAAVPVGERPVDLKLEADFSPGKDVCAFYYKGGYKDRYKDGDNNSLDEDSDSSNKDNNSLNESTNFPSRWQKIGPEHQLRFRLDHFCGCRFGLTVYSTKEAGGSAGFSDFIYHER